MLAAQGSRLYFAGGNAQPEDYGQIWAWDFSSDEREQLFGTAADNMWDVNGGALRPDGRELLLFSQGNLLSLPLAE